MKPGRELDALVAEKVFGWKFVGKFTLDPDLQCDRWAVDSNGLERFYYEVPDYSTNIANAWKVVEKIKDFRPCADAYGPGSGSNQQFMLGFIAKQWTCGWQPVNLDGAFTEFAEAETAPHAICLAALKAVDYAPEPQEK